MVIWAMLLAGCVKAPSASEPHPVPVGVGNVPAQFGSYTAGEVDSLKRSLANIAFPVQADTVARCLPRPLKELPVEYVDWLPDRGKKGRVGGMIVEYWLNSDAVLKVATAYYSLNGRHENREEWAVILTRAERENYARGIY